MCVVNIVGEVSVALLSLLPQILNDKENNETQSIQYTNKANSPQLSIPKKPLVKDNTNESTNKNQWTFKKYCDKYDSLRVIPKVEKKVRDGHLAKDDVFTEVFKDMDPTDDLLSLNIEPLKSNARTRPNLRRNLNGSELYPNGIQLSPNGTFMYPNGTELYQNDTRRFPAFGPQVHQEYMLPYDKTKTKGGFDPFYIRARLMELMKQAIYNVRIKMVPMQMIRSQFLNNSLYKMGFLISKTDNKCKVYSKVAWLAWRACMNFRQDAGGGKQHTILDMLPTEERLLHLRLEIDLLVDLVMANERRALRVIAKYRDQRVERFKFQD